MAHSRSNLNLTNPIKELVSKRRNRYRQDGFNLDLTYITKKIIAMGFPASKIEGCYRNHIDDVAQMLDLNHPDRYVIYNLCSERSYQPQKFHNRVRKYPFDDHNPPRLELIKPFCDDVQAWLSKDEDNVAVVHCKAGKGRTGTMICCYLLHSRFSPHADAALSFYGQTRTQDKKGVTIPSQVRYVRYYARIVRDELEYRPVALYLTEIRLEPPPTLGNRQVDLHFSVYDTRVGGLAAPAPLKLYKSSASEMHRQERHYSARFKSNIALRGDVKIELHSKSMIAKKAKLFQFWFNTFFVDEEAPMVPAAVARAGAGPSQGAPTDANGFLNNCGQHHPVGGGAGNRALVLCLGKADLDIVNKKDKQNKVFSADFKITLHFLKKAGSEPTDGWMITPALSQQQERSSGSSEDSDTDSSAWDSGESTVL